MKNVEDIYPLTPMQQGMLFHALYNQEQDSYLEQMRWNFEGELDVDAFEHAWQQVVQRHAILRTAFLWEGLEEMLQVVRQHVVLPLTRHDLSDLPPPEQQRQVAAMLAEDRAQGVSLTEAPLMRLRLIHLSAQSHHVIWSYHHLLLDGWSVPQVLGEVFAFYEAARRGARPTLGKVRPYRDYIAWLQRQDAERAKAYWQRRLRGFRSPTRLGAERAGGGANEEPASPALPSGQFEARLSRETTGALNALARQHQLTLNTVVQGAWAVLLSRYSGESDVVYGMTVAGRPAELAGVEQMIGMFINTLPMRVEINEGSQVVEWMQELQRQMVESREYEYSSLTQIRAWNEMPSGVPLFESIFVYENRSLDDSMPDPVKNGGLGVSDLIHHLPKTNYPLTVVAMPGRELLLHIIYDQQLYDAPTVTRMMRHLQTILEGIAAHPESQLSRLPMLTDEEQHQLLVEFNRTSVPYPDNTTIHGLFEQQASRTPDAPALVYEDETLTYAELDRRASLLAARLQRLGVRPEQRVALLMERSAEMVIAVLGVLKAGGAYVPIDPAYPQERVRFMTSDAGVSLVLTQQRLTTRLAGCEARILCIDEQQDAMESEQARDTVRDATRATADSLAYVCYTSGSTGLPKGTEVCHRSVIRLLVGSSYARLSPEETFLQLAPLSFDASVFEIYGALLHGAKCVVFPPGPPTYKELGEVLGRHKVSTLWLTASLFNSVIDETPDILSGVRQLLIGGEALSVAHVRRAQKLLHGTRIINGYGPTESTTFTCCYQIPNPLDENISSIPIGRPIANTEVYVLDHTLRPLPPGLTGELYIGGHGLARGYLSRPALTAERFIPHPFSTEPGARLYRTGDVVRWQATGELEFVGRADEQVKVRGFRIEPGEIEAVLRRHAGVREAVVVAREGRAGSERRLVAYVVAAEGVAASGREAEAELQEYLRGRLPEYMMPGAFVWLERLPLTRNGKIDKEGLPEPERRVGAGGEQSRPRNEVEETLAGVWAEVLGAEQVGIHDNFFELGGHSLLATQLISRVRKLFNVEASLRSFFEAPTVADLSALIDDELRAKHKTQLPPVERVPRGQDLPLSYPQQRLWFLYDMDPDSAAFNISMLVRIAGALDARALERSLNEIIRRHEVLRTTFASVAQGQVQRIHPAGQLTLSPLDLRALPAQEQEREVRRVAAEQARQPFDLTKGPLLRITLLRCADEEHILALTMHHIITDGWSMGVIIRELAALYGAFSEGKTSPLPDLPVQYADFAAYQRRWLQGEVLENLLGYWKRQLAGAPPLLDLSDRGERPRALSYRGSTHRVSLPKELTVAVKALSRNEGVTLFMTLLAAFNLLLSYRTGQKDVVVGTDIANRNRAETEGLIGFFVNQLVLRTVMSPDMTFRELLARVSNTVIEAYAHQDLPFDRLVDALKPERSLSHTPLFQVKLVLQNNPTSELSLPGLRFSVEDVETSTAQFDLTLNIADAGDGLQVIFIYKTDLLAAETVGDMAAHFREILSEVVAQPGIRLVELEERLRGVDARRRQAREEELEAANLRLLKSVRQRAPSLP